MGTELVITSIHWQNVRVPQAVESKFLTKITSINNRKFNCIIEAYQHYCFSVNMGKKIWGKKILLYRSNALPPPPWTEPKILIQTHQRGRFMHFQSGVLPLSLIFKGGGRVHQYFWFSKWVRLCVLFLSYFDKIFLRLRSSGSANESVAKCIYSKYCTIN
jgi:hypothetical protein